MLRYLVPAWLTGAVWGAASLVLLLETNPAVQFLLVVSQIGIVAGGAVRNSPVRLVAQGQAMLTLLPLLACSLARADPFHTLFAGMVLFKIFGVRAIINTAHGRLRALLLANEENGALTGRLAENNRLLDALASTDALTSLPNRRGFDFRLAQDCSGARSENEALSLLLLDVDHFKLFNDHYGHQTGDDCLRRIGAALRAATEARSSPSSSPASTLEAPC